jgi:Uma2 family endonuclease
MMNMPITLRTDGMMTEAEFFRFCQINDTMQFERDANKNIILMSPTGSFSGNFNLRISGFLFVWNEDKKLGQLFDSSTGFTLPNGAVRSPDVSWIRNEKWDVLSQEQKEQFAPICPDFVIEIRSKSDDIKYLKDKMDEYIANGTQLGWLIDRFEMKVYIHKPGVSVEILDSTSARIPGENVLPGFILDLGLL